MRRLRTFLALLLCVLLLILFSLTKEEREEGSFLELSRRVTVRLLESDEVRAVFGIEPGEESFA
ncbi:MAG: hypothetical protein J6J21_02885 [Clostridia bacterium]|nr:hypothetical protein [Clostridia bacterium]MBQ2730588.1 hypothetical protein [Clostridia bacterium]